MVNKTTLVRMGNLFVVLVHLSTYVAQCVLLCYFNLSNARKYYLSRKEY